MKKIIITESQYHNLLNESLSDILYHTTTIQNCYNIVDSDKLFLTSALGSESDNLNAKELYYICFTRQRSTEFGFPYNFKHNNFSFVRIEFDGRKLSHKFKGRPFDYWSGVGGEENAGKQSYYQKHGLSFKEKQHHSRFESEDRLLYTKPFITNASNYIKRIDIFLNEDDIDYDKNKQYINLILNYSSYGDLTYVYNNIKDFNFQTENIINNVILNSDINTSLIDKPEQKNYYETLLTVLAVILYGEFDNNDIDNEVKKLLKYYNLEKYYNESLTIDIITQFNNFFRLINNLKYLISKLKHEANEETANINKIVSDYFIKKRLKTIDDLVNYKATQPYSTFDINNYIGNFDTDKEIEFLVFDNGYNKILIPDPDKISFWDVVETNTLTKDDFIQELSHETGDKNIEFLNKKNISISNMLSVLDKLNISKKEVEHIFHGKFKNEKIDYFLADLYLLPKYKNITSDDTKLQKANKNEILKFFLK